MAKDLRSFLDRMTKYYPQGILTVKEEKGRLNPNECECNALLMHLGKMDKWPTVIFENVATLSGERWPGRIIFSELASWAHAAAMIDLDLNKTTVPELLGTLQQRGKQHVPWQVVDKGNAPVKEVIWEGDNADLRKLPSYRKDAGDARPGWFSGIGVAKDLETGRYNCSWHRHHVLGPKKSTVRVNPRHLREMMERYKEAGYQEIPIAWVFGHHPIFLMGSAFRVGWDVDEYEFMGGFLGEPLRLTASETLGEDFLVPADAEVVVEGFLHLTEKDLSGPWSDFMLYYSAQTLEPVFRPSAITMRKDPIFSENLTGYDMIGRVAGLTQMPLVLRQRFPRVKAVNYLAPFTYVIQFKPNYTGEVYRLASYAMGCFGDKLKNVIIVDEDIDPFDPSMVLYSIATRVDASTNRVQVIKDLLSSRQDPSSEANFLVGGLIIDSTKPVSKPFPEIGSVPPEVMERCKITDYLSAEEINRVPSGRK
jgi:2,5-furandicarboxylate decarboxylase 1